jgi:hypothetical protein
MNLGQFVGMIDGEAFHAIDPIGIGNGRPTLDRVMKMQLRLFKEIGHQRHLGKRSDVEAGDPCFIERGDDRTFGIALHRIKDFARKAFDKGAGGIGQPRRFQTIDRIAGLQPRHHRIDIRKTARGAASTGGEEVRHPVLLLVDLGGGRSWLFCMIWG